MHFNTTAAANLLIYYGVQFLCSAAVLLVAFPVHECAHGLTALALGDRTAKNMGRLTLNPFRHLDLIGTICLIFAGFGWAKPVPIDSRNFRNPKVGMAVTAAAGPLSNIALAFLSLLLLAVIGEIPGLSSGFYAGAAYFLQYAAFINISLFVFNLIPVPPLDGSRLLALAVPGNFLAVFERYGILPLMLIVFVFWRFISGPISSFTNLIFSGMAGVLHLG